MTKEQAENLINQIGKPNYLTSACKNIIKYLNGLYLSPIEIKIILDILISSFDESCDIKEKDEK